MEYNSKKEFAVDKSENLNENVVNQKKYMKLIGELQYAAQLRCEVSPFRDAGVTTKLPCRE